VLTLERESHARKRGANILAEVAGYGSSADAYHITAPVEDGSVAARAMRQALDSAEVNLEDIDYINAHGTGTVLNDVSETKAIKFVFGDLAYRVPVSSTKSMTGHMMGATAALEAVFCVKVIQEGILPPTIHYQTPDPQCDLDYVPNQARDKRVKVVMSNSFGFGGHNAVLVFRAYT
jgi:3-oxoacyl-[acyl-carrier-protein] synthase II